MEMKEEILKRLNNADQDFGSNLAYGVKLWKSNSFYYMSKYEVIFEFFLDNVVGFLAELAGLSSATEFGDRWQIVNEFLALPCPSNAIPPRLIPKLRNVFRVIREKHGDGAIPRALLESYLVVAFDVKYKNFYKFDYESYGKTLHLALDCYVVYLKEHFVAEEEEETIKRVLDDVRIYVKSAGDDEKWRKAFTFALKNLCEVVLALKAHGLDRHEELMEVLREVFFQDGKSSNYNRVLDQSKKRLLMSYFDPNSLPIHVVALLIEGYLRAYREIKLDVLLFLKYILLHVFVDPEKSILSDAHQIFQLTNYVFHLLKKYFIKIDQKLVQDFDFTGIFTVKLKEFLEKYESSEEQLRDIFSLICTINEYNPLILETSIIDIILRTMFIKKGPETTETFQAMLISTIGLYVKLNRSENFREELFMKLGDYLDDHDLGDRLKELRKVSKKRKSLAAATETPGKRRKLEDGEATVVQKSSTDEEFYLKLLYPSQSEDSTKKVFRLQLQDQWQSIAFAWPDSNGHLNQAMMDYVKGLLTKRSFTYWRKMQDYLEESLENLGEEQDETELFKLELATCWMCYFFAGNTLIEQTNLFWEKLGKQFTEFDELMVSFGRMLLDGTAHEGRMFDSFLKLVYFYGNYRLIVHYYRPDSIEDSQNDRIHQYLSDEEWTQLEKLVPSSGSALLNRIHLQRIRVSQLNGETEDRQPELVEKILAPEGFDQLRWLLLDRSTNCWFLQLLSLEQKISVVDRLLNSNCYAEIEHIVEQLSDDHVLMEVVVLSTYKKITETVFGECKSSVSRKLSFEGIYEFDEAETMAKIRKLLEKKAEKKDDVLSVANVDQLRDLLKILSEIRIDEIAETEKMVIVAVGILVFTDVMTCGEPDVITLHGNIINKQLTFGMVPNLLKFLEIETLIRIFGQSSPVLVAFIRQTATYLTEEAFASLRATLQNFLQQSDERFELVLSVFFYLQKSNANRRKLIPAEQLSELIGEYVSAIEAFIAGKTAKKVRKSNLDLFNNLLKGCSLIVHYKAVGKRELSDELREVLLQYIDQALKVDSLSSSTLLTNALQHKDFLKLDPERIDLVVKNRWSGFLTQLRHECQSGAADCSSANSESDVDAAHMQSKNVKVFAAFLTHHQKAKKLTVRFSHLEKEAASDRSYRTKQFVLRVYGIFAKNAFGSGVSQDVEKVFVRSFGNVVADEILPLCVMKKFFDDRSCLEEILSCFSAVVSNPKLTLVPSIMDNMLEFLSCVNIRKCAVKDGEEKAFYQLHRLISDVLYLMMIIRPNYVANRLPQYFYVYNGLIASIISYKEDRPLEKPLNSFEILTLSDLLLPLEKIMSHAGKKVAKDLRIMAPYVLAQIIHFIIQSKRSTTLHEKISRTVYNICYGLIEIYDKHSSSYLLRTCDEASKNVYTEIVKGFRKYRSFKGKV